MSNHVHLVLIPHRVEALALRFTSTVTMQTGFGIRGSGFAEQIPEPPIFLCESRTPNPEPRLPGAGESTARDRGIRHRNYEMPGLSLGAEVHARAIRILWERFPCLERARVAGAVLFLPVGRRALVAGFPLHRVEPGARGIGGGGRDVEVVQCRGSLRVSRTRRLPRHRAVAPSLVGGNLAEVLGGGRSRIRSTSLATLHSYGASAGRSGVHPETRTGDRAVLDSTEGRPSPKRHCGQAGGVRLRQIARHRARCQSCEGKPVKRPVCPQIPPKSPQIPKINPNNNPKNNPKIIVPKIIPHKIIPQNNPK